MTLQTRPPDGKDKVETPLKLFERAYARREVTALGNCYVVMRDDAAALVLAALKSQAELAAIVERHVEADAETYHDELNTDARAALAREARMREALEEALPYIVSAAQADLCGFPLVNRVRAALAETGGGK